MSSSIFPTQYSEIFIPGLWRFPNETFTREYADQHYLRFPLGQGAETIPAIKIGNSQEIKGILAGKDSSGASAGTVTFADGYTFASIPYVTATINTTALNTASVLSISIYNITTTGFSYSKMFTGTGATYSPGAGFSAPFNWIAIGV